MHTMLIVLAATSQLLYEAQVATYGCSSSADVAQLQSVRTDKSTFEKRLMEHVFLGECVVIGQRAVVEAAPETSDAAVLRVERRRSPPGYMAPLGDFTAKEPDAER